ncbi:MAG: hypothetical protein KC646_13675 [Candidatus Cloacimonetes bacterium]|nr:hypothetical protein [Candidatus Cloacimonadota bacterium]
MNSKLRLFILLNLLAYCVSPMYAKTKKEKIFSRVGSLVFELDFDSYLKASSTHKLKSTTKEIPEFLLEFKAGHFSKKIKVIEGGSTQDSIPENLYTYIVKANGIKIYENQFQINNGRKTHVQLSIEGVDHRSKSLRYIFTQKITGDSVLKDIKFDYGDWQKKVKADGTQEFYHNGLVTILRDGEQSTRFDYDNDGLSDFDDPDDDNDGIMDRNDHDDDNDGIRDLLDTDDQDNDNDGILNENEVRDNLLGKFQQPVIVDFKIKNLNNASTGLYSKLGELLQLEVKVNEGGGSLVHQVRLSIYKNGDEALTFTLYDDGSILDINSDWEGKQITGDLKKGDGIFTYLLPLDLSMWELLYNSTWVVHAKNITGKNSNTFTYSSGDPIGQFTPKGRSSILEKIKSINLNYHTDPSAKKIEKADINLELSSSCKVQMYHGNKIYFLYPEKKSLQEFHYFDNLTVHQGSIFILTIFDASGGLFYIGDRF